MQQNFDRVDSGCQATSASFGDQSLHQKHSEMSRKVQQKTEITITNKKLGSRLLGTRKMWSIGRDGGRLDTRNNRRSRCRRFRATWRPNAVADCRRVWSAATSRSCRRLQLQAAAAASAEWARERQATEATAPKCDERSSQSHSRAHRLQSAIDGDRRSSLAYRRLRG